MTSESWPHQTRDAVREFLGAIQPNNPAILVNNIEDFMPAPYRKAFDELIERLGSIGAVADVWVIWSGEHKKYWGPNERGYVDELAHAGVYTRQRAQAIASRPAIGRAPNEAFMILDARDRALEQSELQVAAVARRLLGKER